MEVSSVLLAAYGGKAPVLNSILILKSIVKFVTLLKLPGHSPGNKLKQMPFLIFFV